VDLAARQQPLKEELMRALEGVINSGQFILGPETAKFEQEFAALCDTAHAIGVNSGTDALILALRASGISAGDEVITAPNSYLASASCIALAGATVRFADVRDDLNMDPAALESAITPNTKAVIVVHLTGRPAAMDEILSITKPRGLVLIEDAAQAVGAKFRGKPVGSLGDIACFSMHPLKNLDACGDAGIVVTDSAESADRIRLLRNHGQPNRDDCLEFSMVSRLDSIQAAMLCVKLHHLDTVTSRRRKNAELYRQLLSDIPDLQCPVDKPEEFSVYHTFVIQAERRDALKQFLAEAGIGTAIHYPTPIHLMQVGRKLGFRPGMFPVAERQAEKILSLPVHEGLPEQDVRSVASEIRNFYSHN